MSQILNAIEMANKAGLGHFLHQDPISKERRTSRGRHTSQNRRRSSNSFWDNVLF